MDHRLLGMDRNVCIGLAFLFSPIALIAVLVEKNKNATREDRVMLWTAFITAVLSAILWWACLIIYAFCIIAAIFAFQGKFDKAKVPLITYLVDRRVH
ncbi:MAG: hypothetical protein IKZ19_08500 [Clostridia bacterium]|nr:hypothetical protein [Clostridia bacterium]